MNGFGWSTLSNTSLKNLISRDIIFVGAWAVLPSSLVTVTSQYRGYLLFSLKEGRVLYLLQIHQTKKNISHHSDVTEATHYQCRVLKFELKSLEN